MRGRVYRLTSTWLLPAPAPACWEALADPALSWPHWWPGVSGRDVAPGLDGIVGSTASVVFRSPLRYALALRLEVVAAREGEHVRLAADGDLVGSAEARLAPVGRAHSRLDVVWHVRPTVPWMVLAGPALAPAFAGAHRAMMRAGHRGLCAYLASSG